MTQEKPTKQSLQTPDQRKALLVLMFGNANPDSSFYKELFCNSLAVHLDPILAFENVCRCADWIQNNNPTQ